MKFVFPEINHILDTGSGKVPTLIIENQGLLFRLLNDIHGQLEGYDGKCIVSSNGKILDLSKNLELITEFVPFSINKKNLLNKAMSALEREAMEGDRYVEAMEILQQIEAFLMKASFNLNGDISFSKLNLSTLIKAVGMEFHEDYDTLSEKVIDYMELVSEFEREKLFILYNLRCLISDQETELLFDTILHHGFNVIMIEGHEHKRLSNEKRYIIDDDLCEIC